MKNKKNIKYNDKKVIAISKKGFTLIEIVISMSVITILSAAMFQIVSVSDTGGGLIMASDKVKAGLRLAQSYSLSVPQSVTSSQRIVCGYGVYSEGASSELKIYYLYNSDFEIEPDACVEPSYLDHTAGGSLTKVEDTSIDLGEDYVISEVDFFFKAPYGEVYSDHAQLGGSDTKNLTLMKGAQSKVIKINGSGKISF